MENTSEKQGTLRYQHYGACRRYSQVVLVIIWLQNMISTDKFYSHEDQFYILCKRDAQQGNVFAWQYIPKILVPTLGQDYPELEDTSRYGFQQMLFTNGETKITSKGAFADTGLLRMF